MRLLHLFLDYEKVTIIIQQIIMKSLQLNPNSVNSFNSTSTAAIINTNSEMQNLSVIDFYKKHHDEPDFDCEFLYSTNQYDEQDETILDLESDEEFDDQYNDKDWDVSIYDPYLESTYF